jgi:hypothetical protein
LAGPAPKMSEAMDGRSQADMDVTLLRFSVRGLSTGAVLAKRVSLFDRQVIAQLNHFPRGVFTQRKSINLRIPSALLAL